jgi:hypothetical protein
MGDMLKLIWWAVIGLFRSRASLEAAILTLRHQLNVLRPKSPNRVTFTVLGSNPRKGPIAADPPERIGNAKALFLLGGLPSS